MDRTEDRWRGVCDSQILKRASLIILKITHGFGQTTRSSVEATISDTRKVEPAPMPKKPELPWFSCKQHFNFACTRPWTRCNTPRVAYLLLEQALDMCYMYHLYCLLINKITVCETAVYDIFVSQNSNNYNSSRNMPAIRL